jgi:hypothetical protein
VSNGTGAGPDPQTTIQEAAAWFEAFRKFCIDKGVSEWQAQGLAAGPAMDHVKTASMVAKIAGSIVSGLAEIAAGALNGLEEVKQNSGSGINSLMSAALTDLFGADVNLSPGTEGSGSGNPTVDKEAVGKAVFAVLTDMFGGLQPVTPEQGSKNAQAFLGFGVNFAVVEAFLGILGGFVPYLHLEELKGIGEDVAHSLGLGRLTHTALRPLVRNMVSQPMDLWLRDICRPDRLSEGQVVRAFRAGTLPEADTRQALAEKGYRDADIDLLIADLTAKIAASELFTLVRNGDLTTDAAIAKLTDAGMDADNAKLQFKALDEAKADSQVGGILSDLEGAFTDGFIDSVAYNAALDKLPLSDSEDAMFRMKVGLHQERPRKRITFAQMQKGVVQGVVDFTYMDTWLTAEGYGPEDQNILTFEVLEALKSAEDKVKFMEYKANVLRKAGKPVPPWLLPG